MLASWGEDGLEDRWADGRTVTWGWRRANLLEPAEDIDCCLFFSLLDDESVMDAWASRDLNQYLGYRDPDILKRWQSRYAIDRFLAVRCSNS